MSEEKIVIPKLGESVTGASVVKWLKNIGDKVMADEPVMDIATDKVDTEVLAPCEGILLNQLVKEGDEVAIGQTIATLKLDTVGESATHNNTTVSSTEETVVPVNAEVNESAHSKGRFISPLVKKIAATEGLSADELNNVSGSGVSNRVTKADLNKYLASRNSQSVSTQKSCTPKIASSINIPSVPVMPGDEIIEMDRMRTMIAEHMVRSKQVAPHVTAFAEADMTSLVLWRNKVKAKFEQKYGEKLTFTPLIIDAMVKAIKDMPLINVAVDETGSKIIKRKLINIGMATALPSGNLIVPVIKNADDRNLLGLTKEVNRLANNARNNKLLPDEVQGGTITLSNVGSFGNIAGTPIINQPQAAILAVGTIAKKPAVVETPEGDMIAIRHKMILSLSFDHRVVDGSLGGVFVKRVADYLENWDINQGF